MAFFEQIGKKLTGAGQNVATQTKNLAGIAQLNNAISEKEKKISQLLMSIGQSYYEKHKYDETAEERDKCSEINTLYADILQDREKIKQIKGVTKCPNCGADVPIGAAFCNGCGARMVNSETLAGNINDVRLCPVCHAPVPKDNLFCTNCGAKLSDLKTSEDNSKSDRVCPVCHEPIKEGDLFCTICGAKITESKDLKENQKNVCICPACHEPVEDGNLFCTNCGAKLDVGKS